MECKNQNWEILGIEPNDIAKGIAVGKGIKFGDTIEKLESNSFDVITMWHVLEHVPDVEHQVAELKRLLKPSGTIIIAVPNFKSYDAKYYKESWAAYDVPRHLWHFSKTAIEKLFDKQNMNLEDKKRNQFKAICSPTLLPMYGGIAILLVIFIIIKLNGGV